MELTPPATPRAALTLHTASPRAALSPQTVPYAGGPHPLPYHRWAFVPSPPRFPRRGIHCGSPLTKEKDPAQEIAELKATLAGRDYTIQQKADRSSSLTRQASATPTSRP